MNTTSLDEESLLNEVASLSYVNKKESKVRLMDIYTILKNKHVK